MAISSSERAADGASRVGGSATSAAAKAALRNSIRARLTRWCATGVLDGECELRTEEGTYVVPNDRPPWQESADAMICQHLGNLLLQNNALCAPEDARSLPLWSQHKDSLGKVQPTIGAFLPVATEVDLRPLMGTLQRRGFSVVVPVCQPAERQLAWAAYDDALTLPEVFNPLTWRPQLPDLELAQDGVAPALTPDIIVAPCVGFTYAGFRLGYGGGFYDATIAAIRTARAVTMIGVAYSLQEFSRALEEGLSEGHDVRLDGMVTERGYDDCRS